uniref:hypothetical protein n=1 Tax=Leyella stercorea TaxID=363265 RepID=UPI00242D9BF8
QYGLVIYGLSSIHDAKINNNIGLLKTQQYYLIPTLATFIKYYFAHFPKFYYFCTKFQVVNKNKSI